MKRKRKRKSTPNVAICLLIISTILLSTLQVGFSFFNSEFLMGGNASIKIENQTLTKHMIVSANTNNLTNGSSDASGPLVADLGYSEVIRGTNGELMNNYLKFSESATELWRIIGFTEDGIKIVKDTVITANTEIWDSASNHWVEWDAFTSIPNEISVTSLTNASAICTYLNTTYYETLTNVSNVNYADPAYINHEARWDITPMNIVNGEPYYVSNTNAQSLTCKGVVSNTFQGLPIGLLNISEIAVTSSDFETATSNVNSSAFTSWLATNNSGTEMTITERIQTDSLSSSITSKQALWFQVGKYNNSNKTSTKRTYRPAMILFNDIKLSNLDNATGEKGSIDNPFIVAGRG